MQLKGGRSEGRKEEREGVSEDSWKDRKKPEKVWKVVFLAVQKVSEKACWPAGKSAELADDGRLCPMDNGLCAELLAIGVTTFPFPEAESCCDKEICDCWEESAIEDVVESMPGDDNEPWLEPGPFGEAFE